jgi:HB1, ASXL, restriction endonuclease HTH domain
VDFLDAAVAVLRENGGPLHWTVIQDRALKKGYLDPFAQRDVRKQLLAALARGAREGKVQKVGTGMYALPER